MCKIKTKTHVAIIAFVLTFTFGVGVAFFYISQKYSLRPFTQPTSLCVAKKTAISAQNLKVTNTFI